MKTNDLPSQAAELEQQPEQVLYARVLDAGTKLGLLLLVVSFAAYVLGAWPPHVPLEHLPEVWMHPAGHYRELTASPIGWQWVSLVRHADFANLVGIAVLAGNSVLCLLALLPTYARQRDRAYIGLCLTEAAVLLLAASGVLAVGR